MSSFLDYIKNLAPSFRRDDVLENINPIRESIKSHTLAGYIQAERLFQANKPKSVYFKSSLKDFELATGARAASGETVVTLIKNNLEATLVFLDALEEQAKVILNPTEANLGITYPKATVLRLVEAAFFFNNYAGSFLNRLLIEETKLAENEVKLDADMKKPELAWLDKHWADFCHIASILRRDASKLGDSLQKLPEASITALSEKTLPSSLGMGKIDPFRLQGLSVESSPLFKVAMSIANRQANNYKAKQEELNLLQVRMYNLQRLYEGKNDLQVQEQIKRLQTRVSGLHADLAKDGVKYGL